MDVNRSAVIGAVVLAAGGSSRLGTPKQLVEFDGRSLLRRSVEALEIAGFSPIVVVLGAEAERCRAELKEGDVQIAVNASWQDGLSSSIRVGIQAIAVHPVDAAAITLCDQPLVTAGDLSELRTAFLNEGPAIVAAQYDGVLGVPAVFSRPLFAELIALTGDRGAGALIRQQTSVLAVEMPNAGFDIDSPPDLTDQRFLRT